MDELGVDFKYFGGIVSLTFTRLSYLGLKDTFHFCSFIMNSFHEDSLRATPPAEGPRGEGRPPRGLGRGRPPAEGPGGRAARRGATAAAAVGPGKEGGEAPKDYTEPRQTIQSPDRQYKKKTSKY